MYTNFNKAAVAVVVAVIGLVGIFWHPINVSNETIAAIMGVLTPILVYFVPNLPKDPA